MRKTIVLIVVVGLSGCSSKAVDRVKRTNQLKLIGLAFHDYDSRNDRAPTQPSDLNYFLGMHDFDFEKMVTSGDLIFIWGVSARDASKKPDGARGKILAYEKEVPTKGGLVLYGDGVVENISAEEFSTTPKAK